MSVDQRRGPGPAAQGDDRKRIDPWPQPIPLYNRRLRVRKLIVGVSQTLYESGAVSGPNSGFPDGESDFVSQRSCSYVNSITIGHGSLLRVADFLLRRRGGPCNDLRICERR